MGFGYPRTYKVGGNRADHTQVSVHLVERFRVLQLGYY